MHPTFNALSRYDYILKFSRYVPSNRTIFDYLKEENTPRGDATEMISSGRKQSTKRSIETKKLKRKKMEEENEGSPSYLLIEIIF